METAREMIGAGWHNWLIPHCDGEVRLQKPPLAYWAAAGAFKLFGVHDWAGRIPFELASWLLLAATFAAARPIIGRRAALLASAMLAGSYFLIRFGRFAETDILAALFVTTAIAGLIHGALAQRWWAKSLYYNAAGASIGLAVISKGPPAIFPVLFILALPWLVRRMRILAEFLRSGAILTMLIIAAPWWIYIWNQPEFAVVGSELKVIATGADHPGRFWFYAPEALLGSAPWCVFVLLGIIGASARLRVDLRARILLLWICCIFIPLSLVPQKQDHYILPLLPALAAAAAWAIERGLRQDALAMQWNRLVLLCTAIGGAAAAAIPLIEARQLGRRLIAADFLLAVAILLSAIVLFTLAARAGKRLPSFWQLLSMMAASAIVLGLAVGFWRPARDPTSYPLVARQIDQQFAGHPLVLYDAENLPICFYLGRTIPYIPQRDQLMSFLESHPDAAIIWEEQRHSHAPPPGVDKLRIDMQKRQIVVYELK